MRTFLEFGLLGLGVGAVYSLLSQGLVLIYRGSGVLNIAQGAFAYLGAVVYYELHDVNGLPTAAAVVIAVACGLVVGGLVQPLIMRPMRHASALARLIATLGLMIFIENVIDWRTGDGIFLVKQFLPSGPVHFTTGITVGEDRLFILGIAVAATALLWFIYSRTRFGYVTSTVATNPQTAASLGHSPNKIATVNWAIGGAFAALAGVLISPIIGLAPNNLTLLVVPALAIALLAKFTSFPIALVTGLAMGIVQSEFAFYYPRIQGLGYALPFALIIGILFFRGRSIPERSHVAESLPAVGRGGFNYKWAIPLAILVAVLARLLSTSWMTALSLTFIGMMFCLSLVVITGFAGQLSLCQFVMGGVAGWVTGLMTEHWGLPFAAALVIGPLATIPVGLIIGVPSLRTRGVNLAVVTLGFAVVIENMVFGSDALTGGFQGVTVGNIHFFGFDVNPITNPWAFGMVALGGALVCGFVVATVRRSATGRRLLAVRSNERAASSLGISVFGAKLYAFSLSASIAGLAGVFFAYSNTTIEFSSFSSVASTNLVLYAVIAGIGFTTGGVLGGILIVGGIVAQVAIVLFHSGQLYQAIAGGLLIVTVVLNPNGAQFIQIQLYDRLRKKVLERFPQLVRSRRAPSPALATTGAPAFATIAATTVPAPVTQIDHGGATAGLANGSANGASTALTDAPTATASSSRTALEVFGLTVVFGGVHALNDVSFAMNSGEVLGLIGPNGAGKTTAIDAISGFIPNYKGSVKLQGRELRGASARVRAQLGVRRTFQSLELFEDMTVFENILAACEPHSRSRYLIDLVAPKRAAMTESALKAIDDFGLGPDLERLPSELPYGRRRLVGIARAVAQPAKVLLLDEPAAGLDSAESEELGSLVRSFAARNDVAVLLVEHDVDLVLTTCDRLIALDFGKWIGEGTPAEVLASEVVQDAYFGKPDFDEPPPTPTGDVARSV